MTGALLLRRATDAAEPGSDEGVRRRGHGSIGEFTMWAGKTEPANWMFCRGQAVSRATYATLFAVIGAATVPVTGPPRSTCRASKGAVPIGVYPGGPWANVVGQTGGDADAHVISHAHTVNSHTHGVHINTGNDPSTTTTVTGYGDDGFVTGTGSAPASFAPTRASTNFSYSACDWWQSAPTHPRCRRQHRWIGTSHRCQGVSATNANMPPFTAVNFIIKVA